MKMVLKLSTIVLFKRKTMIGARYTEAFNVVGGKMVPISAF